MSDPNHFPYGKQGPGAQSTEIDYGDIPENMNEQDMRAYLALESKLVMPNQKKRDSFEQQWNQQRAKYQPQQPPQQQKPNYQQAKTTNNGMNFAFQKQQKPQQNGGYRPKPNYKNTVSSTTSKTTVHSNTAYSPDQHDYDPNVVDRMSTVTIVSNKGKHKRDHSFAKQPVGAQYVAQGHHGQQQGQQGQQGQNLPPINQSTTQNQTAQFPYNSNLPITAQNNNNGHGNNNHHRPPQNMASPRSALTAQIQPQKQHLANQSSGQQSGVIQSRNPDGKLVVKQMPYSKKTHTMVNVYVQIKQDHVEHIIVYFSKHFSVKQFLNLLKNETNNAAFQGTDLEIFCADDEGDIDEDFPAPEPNAVLAQLGLKHFFIKLKGASDEQRNDIRRSTLSHKQQLLTTQEMDTMHSLDESESEYEEESYEEDDGCKCIIL